MRETKKSRRLAALFTKVTAGDINAKCTLAMLYATGENGLPVNLVKAFKLYKSAANAGLPEAQYELGIMYLRGEGTVRDKLKGLRWVKRAAKGASAVAVDAQDLLGAIYEFGAFGFRLNNRKAANWYKISTANGNSKARYSLGLMYLHGKGVARNRSRGLRLIRTAARARYIDAKKFLKGNVNQKKV